MAGQDKKPDYAVKAGKETRVKTVNMDNGITLKQSWTKETNQTLTKPCMCVCVCVCVCVRVCVCV